MINHLAFFSNISMGISEACGSRFLMSCIRVVILRFCSFCSAIRSFILKNQQKNTLSANTKTISNSSVQSKLSKDVAFCISSHKSFVILNNFLIGFGFCCSNHSTTTGKVAGS
jgi:hypothetical protein